MCVTVRSCAKTRGGPLPYSGFVMDGGTDRTRPKIDITSLEVHRRYRVDWKNEQLRRSFRFAGTLLSIEQRRPRAPGRNRRGGWRSR